MGKSMFARGYSASRAEKERQDRARENAGKRLFRFFLKDDGEEADLRFLTEQPVNFYEHNIKKGDRFVQYCCTGENCPFCEDGDRPTYKGAFLVVDHREFDYTDRDGKKQKGKDQVRLFVQGMRVVAQLDRISEKYGLTKRDVTMVRLGKGTSTSYTIERGDTDPLTKKQIENYLPEKIRDQYDGTEDSLMQIVEDQLMLMVDSDVSDEEEEDEVEETTSGRDRLIGYDDDDDDDSSDEEEEEEKKPKKRKLSSAGSKKRGMFKKAQNSVKPRVKQLLKNMRED